MFVCNYRALPGFRLRNRRAYFGGLVDDDRARFDFAGTAMFLALLVPQCSSRAAFLVAILPSASQPSNAGSAGNGIIAGNCESATLTAQYGPHKNLPKLLSMGMKFHEYRLGI